MAIRENFRGVFDIETEDWDLFACGMALDATTGETLLSWDPDELWRWMAAREGDWYAHNAGKYDALWWIDHGARRGEVMVPIAPGPSVISCETRSCGVNIRDSMAIFPMGLAKFAAMGGGQAKIGTGLVCSCGEDCGGYCRIRAGKRGMSDAEVEACEDYLAADVLALHDAMVFGFEYAEEHAIELRSTIGATAWATAQREIGIGKCEWQTPQQWVFAREGYKGGVVLVGAERADSGHRYDLHSAYPGQLATLPVPVGQYAGVGSEMAGRLYRASRPGIYKAVVEVPYSHLPPLPIHHFETERVCFPFGTLSGVWTLPELEYAEELGAKIHRFEMALVWERAEPIFAPMMERLWALRQQAERDGNAGLRQWLKLVLNSVTGKLASRAETKHLMVSGEQPICRKCEADPEACDHWRPLHLKGSVWEREGWGIQSCSHVQIAAYLTASCRIEWHRQAMHAEEQGGGFLYGDTDSVYSRERLSRRLGPEIGWWGYDGPMRSYECLGPKTYAYEDGSGLWVVKAKGLPRATIHDFQTFKASVEPGKPGVVRDRGVMGLKSAARRVGDRLFVRQYLHRRHRPDKYLIGCRARGVITDRTYPVEWRALRRYLSGELEELPNYAK